MFAYTKFLETEIERLRHENKALLAALLESRGLREAAHMLRGGQDQVPAETSKTKTDPLAVHIYDQVAGFMGRSWRTRRSQAEEESRKQAVAETTGDSADQLEARISGGN